MTAIQSDLKLNSTSSSNSSSGGVLWHGRGVCWRGTVLLLLHTATHVLSSVDHTGQ